MPRTSASGTAGSPRSATWPGAAATQTIDATGMVVAPGFIDMLGQSELTVLVDPHLPSKIFQGITTELTGEGGSAAPLNDAIVKADKVDYDHLQADARLAHLRAVLRARSRSRGSGSTWRTYVGATQVRRMVLGDDDKQPGAAELERMKALVREAMEQGAFGVSTSLQYPPAPYAKTEELIALATEAASYGGIYATHMRVRGDAVLEALDEAIRIGREAKIPVEIWHVKAAGKRNWGRMQEIVAKIDAGAPRRRRHHRRHLRLYRVVQFVLRLHPALGARRRRREADRAVEGSGDARAHPQGACSSARRQGLGQRVAGDPGPRGGPASAPCRTRS